MKSSPEGVRLRPGDRALVIANPATRRNAQQLVTKLRMFAPAGVKLDVYFTSRAGEARMLTQSELGNARMVIAIGGDGTVADCADGLREHDVPIAVIPGGSTNITAREQGVPKQAERAARLIFGDHALKRIDAGVCNDRLFLHMAGAGFDARLFKATSSQLKRKVGWMAYMPAAVKAFRARGTAFSLSVDGEELAVRGQLVLIANGPSIISPRFSLHPGIVDNDGLLDVLVATATSPMELAQTVFDLVSGRFGRSQHVKHLTGKHILVTADEEVPLEVDGDVYGDTPAEFHVLEQAVQLVVPRT